MPINKSLYSPFLVHRSSFNVLRSRLVLVLSFAEGVRGGQEGIVRPLTFDLRPSTFDLRVRVKL